MEPVQPAQPATVDAQSNFWNKFKHARWTWALTAFLGYSATLSADLVRAGFLAAAWVFATIAFHQTFSSKRHKRTVVAGGLLLVFAVALWAVPHYWDRISKRSPEPPAKQSEPIQSKEIVQELPVKVSATATAHRSVNKTRKMPEPSKPVPTSVVPHEPSLSVMALRLSALIRKLSQGWQTEQSKIDTAGDVTEQQRNSMSKTLAVKVMAEYDGKYKEDARIMHDKLLGALPIGTDPLVMKDYYENEINPGLLEIVSSNLEHLAKLLPDSQAQASAQTESGITATNNTMAGDRGTAMFDVKELGTGCFDNNTSVGMGILKSDKTQNLAGKNNLSYSDPSARPAPKPGSSPEAGSNRSYNFGDWLDFLDSFDPKMPDDSLNKLKSRLESDWDSLRPNTVGRYRKEFDELSAKLLSAPKDDLWSVTEPLHHKEHIPSFVRMPCQ